MDRTDLVRLRWRLTGAWFWPSFLLLTLVDAAVIHWLPPEGDSESAVGGWLIASALMLLAVVVLSPALGLVLRRLADNMPRLVARNYAGTAAALGVSVALAVAGVIHHHTILADRAALSSASTRAEAWLGTNAPPRFQADVHDLSVAQIQPPTIYRACVADPSGQRYYCVVVNVTRPFGSGVRYDGTESNQLLTQGYDY